MSDTHDKLLNYINGELLTDSTRRAAPDTPLFEDGWIDSLKILKLIAFVELMIGRNIPDEEIVNTPIGFSVESLLYAVE